MSAEDRPTTAHLKPGTHYLYCKKCQDHIPVREIENGEGFIVHCPHCSGECLTCGCHLEHLCYGNLRRAPRFVLVTKEDSKL